MSQATAGTDDDRDADFPDELGMSDTPAAVDGDPGIIRGVERVGSGNRSQTRVWVELEDGHVVNDASERVEVLR